MENASSEHCKFHPTRDGWEFRPRTFGYSSYFMDKFAFFLQKEKERERERDREREREREVNFSELFPVLLSYGWWNFRKRGERRVTDFLIRVLFQVGKLISCFLVKFKIYQDKRQILIRQCPSFSMISNHSSESWKAAVLSRWNHRCLISKARN